MFAATSAFSILLEIITAPSDHSGVPSAERRLSTKRFVSASKHTGISPLHW